MDLDGDLLAVVEDGAVDLADRRRGHRVVAEFAEQLIDRSPEALLKGLAGQQRVHRGRVGLQSRQRTLIGGELAVSVGRDVGDREDLAGFHQHALGVSEKFGVTLRGSFVESVDGALVSGSFTQARDESSARGTGGESGQWHRATDTSVRNVFVAHSRASSWSRRSSPNGSPRSRTQATC
ncbi:Uncharacterised protein [Mycobacteroides abscessus subsp. abscessus]|nr:Uncharacterised protein [Mycobacteroides abscessus subsp. abscessus]